MDPNPITDLQRPPSSPSMITTFPQPITTFPSPSPSPSPPHPPYNEMIRSAIVGLKDKDGSSRQAISKYIEKEFGHTHLPPTHAVMLTHHLKRMRDEGQIVMVKHSYMLPPTPGSAVNNGNDFNVDNTLDFSNPSGGSSVGANGSSLAKRKPGRPPKLKPVPGSGVQNVQVLHDADVQQSYQPPFPFHQGVQGQGFQGQGAGAGFEGSNVGGGGGGGAEPLFVSLGLADEGAAVQSVEKEKGESTDVKRRGRPPKKSGSVGRPAKKGGSGGEAATGENGGSGSGGKAATGENGGSEVQGDAGEAKEVAGGESEGAKRGRGRPKRKGKMILVPTGDNGRLPRPRGRPARFGAAPVTVPLAGNVLRPRGRPKRIGRPVVNGASVRGSRRPLGRPSGSVNKVTNLTGLQLARPAKDGPGTAVLVTDPRQLVIYQELMSKYELLQSKVKQVAGVVKSCIDPNYGSTALGALQELEALAGGDSNAPSHGQT